jgi:hypothetical protein
MPKKRFIMSQVQRLLSMFLLPALCIGLNQPALASGFQTAPYPGGAAPNSVVAGDFNGDRKIDLAVADSCYDLRDAGD